MLICAAAPHEGFLFFLRMILSTLYNSVGTLTAAVMNKVRRVVFCPVWRYGNQEQIPLLKICRYPMTLWNAKYVSLVVKIFAKPTAT